MDLPSQLALSTFFAYDGRVNGSENDGVRSRGSGPGRARVAHVDEPRTEHDVYIGRAVPRRRVRASSLRNPFKIDATRSRDEAIERFASEIFPELVRDAASIGGRDLRDLLARMRGGEDLVLRCWCAPQACHGDTIAAWLNANVET